MNVYFTNLSNYDFREKFETAYYSLCKPWKGESYKLGMICIKHECFGCIFGDNKIPVKMFNSDKVWCDAPNNVTYIER